MSNLEFELKPVVVIKCDIESYHNDEKECSHVKAANLQSEVAILHHRAG